MSYFFENKANDTSLKLILDSWLNTPFRHRCGVKGKGCDCIHFVARVFEELGIFKWRKGIIPDYARDWHLHRSEEQLMNGILRELKAEKIPLTYFMNGDIILFKYGRVSAHASIYYANHTWQSIMDVGVRKIRVDDSEYKKRMSYAFRILS